MAIAQAPAPAARMPFQLFTRWIPEFLVNLPLTLGGARQGTALDQVGYGDMVVLHVKGTYTVATATLVFLAGAPWNLLSQIVIQPPGLSAPIALSGFMVHMWNLVEKNFAPFVNGANSPNFGLDVNAFDAAQVDVFPTTVGAQSVHLWYVLPFHRSSMDVRGVLPLGNKSRTQLQLSVAAAADLVTTAANLTVPVITCDVFQAYYTAPPAGVGADPDPYWSLTYEETSQPIVALGDQPVNIEPNDSIIGLIHYVILNGAGSSTDINSLTLRVNKSYYHQGLPFAFWSFVQRRRIGEPVPAGVVVYDFDRFVDDGALDVREWLHSQDVQTVQSTLNVPTGTLGTIPRIITSVKRLVDLAPGQH